MTALSKTTAEARMKILILHMIVGTMVLMGSIDPPARHKISKRLASLRFRHALRNRQAIR
jgi:hypothetical protein